jgi:hypothetical protein
MKKNFIILLVLVSALSAFSQKSAKLQVVYFHSEHRCPTCISIEDNTKKTLNTYFAEQWKNGTITLQVLNIDDEKNQKLAEKYKAEGSALFLTQIVNKQETTTDFTNFAFSYSRNDPAKFITGLKTEIQKRLK